MLDKDLAIKWLRSYEWSMGNQQCPECNGKGPAWLGFGGWGYEIGHKSDCGVGACLEVIGQFVLWRCSYERKSLFGPVDWDNPTTQRAAELALRAHPEMTWLDPRRRRPEPA